MKNKFLIAAAALVLMTTACSKDNEATTDPEQGEKSVVALNIYDATAAAKSRAAGGVEQTPEPDESAIDISRGIKVVVFNSNGSLAFPAGGGNPKLNLTHVSGVQYKSEEFELTSGDKYFYVFANDQTVIPATIPAGMTRDNFIREVAAASLDPTDELNLAVSNEFLMGTLWSEKKLAPGGGVAGNPATVALTIGRLASKITVSGVEKGASSTVAGTFSDPKYRLGSIPKSIFVVGNNDEATPAPPALGHGVVTSAVHVTDVTNPTDLAKYHDYTSGWKTPALTASFYAVENTTAPDAQTGLQYYGNTTFIQIETKYEPADSEVHDPTTLLPISGAFTGPDFYTARQISTNKILIFETNPTGVNADIDDLSVLYYAGGKNYHKFPVYDANATSDVQKNAVLRNHSYIYKVTNIKSLGSNTSTVPPVEPIESLTTLELEVTVAPWSKIEDDDVTIG